MYVKVWPQLLALKYEIETKRVVDLACGYCARFGLGAESVDAALRHGQKLHVRLDAEHLELARTAFFKAIEPQA